MSHPAISNSTGVTHSRTRNFNFSVCRYTRQSCLKRKHNRSRRQCYSTSYSNVRHCALSRPAISNSASSNRCNPPGKAGTHSYTPVLAARTGNGRRQSPTVGLRSTAGPTYSLPSSLVCDPVPPAPAPAKAQLHCNYNGNF